MHLLLVNQRHRQSFLKARGLLSPFPKIDIRVVFFLLELQVLTPYFASSGRATTQRKTSSSSLIKDALASLMIQL